MATADERELQINPIVGTSVQHNTQVPSPSPSTSTAHTLGPTSYTPPTTAE